MGILKLFSYFIFHLALAQDYTQEFKFLNYSYHFQGSSIQELGVFDHKVPSFEQILQDQYRFNSYDQFLDYLLTQAPTLKKSAVLIHHSQSLQLSSLEHPRILLFDGGSVFAFSEDPQNPVQKLEMMEVDPKTFQVSFKEIVFAKTGVQFNAKPTSCLSCHGSPAKPLWDPYDFWPGAFGSSVGAENSRQEKEAYGRLVANAAQSPLLSRLNLKPELLPGIEGNTPFTQYIGMINIGRWIQSEIADKDLSEIREPLLATLSGCFMGFGGVGNNFPELNQKFLEMFAPGQVAQELKEDLESIYQDSKQARQHFTEFNDQVYLGIFPNPDLRNKIDHKRLSYEQIPVTHLRWLFGIAGVNFSNLSTSFLANDFFFSNPGNFLIDTLTSLYKFRPDLFAGLTVEPISLGTPQERWIRLDCSQLLKKSLIQRRYLERPKWVPFYRDQISRPVFSRCAKCHTERLDPRAPFIPFHDSRLLAQALNENQGLLADKILFRIQIQGPGRMPYRQPALTVEEINAVKDFIASMREKR